MQSRKKINFPIFLKLIILIIVFIILVNISIGIIIRLTVNNGPFRPPNKLSSMFNDYFLKDIGNPPDTIKARAILNGIGLNIRFETTSSDWASSESVPRISDLLSERDFDEGSPKFTIRSKGRFFEIYKTDDGYIIFAPPFPGDDIDITRAIIPLIIIFTILACFLYFSLRWIFGPIKKLSEAVEKISGGDFDTPLEINSKDELGRLASSINNMKISISNMIKSKDSLLIDVSHELRSPLTRIKLANEFVEDPKIKSKIQDDVREMEKMISGLLETYRMENKELKLNKDYWDIVEMVRSVISKFDNAKINLSTDYEQKNIMVDGEKIEIVLRNIIDNAIKYSRGKPVDVGIYEGAANDETLISIRDYGSGIESPEINKIFEPFYRIDKSRDKKISGYGLGLSIVKKILDLHNSSVQIITDHDSGTEFIITLRNG